MVVRLTSLQNLLDFNVVRTKATVKFEVVGVVKKRPSQREEQFLKVNIKSEKHEPTSVCGTDTNCTN